MGVQSCDRGLQAAIKPCVVSRQKRNKLAAARGQPPRPTPRVTEMRVIGELGATCRSACCGNCAVLGSVVRDHDLVLAKRLAKHAFDRLRLRTARG